jgi:hypothetical protein
MPWPVMPRRAHNPASWPRPGWTGHHVGGLQRGDDVTGPVADKRAQLGAGQLPGVVLRDGSRAGEDPGGDDVQQELTGAVCRASAVHVLSVIAMVTGRRGWPGTGSSVS